jgi:hypothetical protein
MSELIIDKKKKNKKRVKIQELETQEKIKSFEIFEETKKIEKPEEKQKVIQEVKSEEKIEQNPEEKTEKFYTDDDFINQSNKILQDITLEYMANSNSLNKIKLSSLNKSTSLKNKKFYRKRIVQLTKDLLTEEIENPDLYHPDIYRSFYKYINTCIDFFQTVDRTDIIQEDYKDLEDSVSQLDDLLEKEEMDANNSMEKANKHIMRQINIKNATLDGLVKRTVIKKEEPILPKKKKINLKDPELKNKGVGKKNNLMNN